MKLLAFNLDGREVFLDKEAINQLQCSLLKLHGRICQEIGKCCVSEATELANCLQDIKGNV